MPLPESIAYFEPDLDTMIGDWKRHGISNGDICRLLAKKINELDPEGAKVVAEIMLKGILS